MSPKEILAKPHKYPSWPDVKAKLAKSSTGFCLKSLKVERAGYATAALVNEEARISTCPGS